MDDATFRALLVGAWVGGLGAIWPLVKKWLYRIGYRDMNDKD